jgi:hypothetical protein
MARLFLTRYDAEHGKGRRTVPEEAMRLLKSVHLNTATTRTRDFMVGAVLSVSVRLAPDEFAAEIATGWARHELQPGEVLVAMTGQEFLETPLGKEMLEKAMVMLVDEVSTKAAQLQVVAAKVAAGGEL